MPKTKFDWTQRDTNQPSPRQIKLTYHTRLIVPATETATGRRYDFRPGQVRTDVDTEDIPILLDMTITKTGCCGGVTQTIRYFEELT